MLYMSISDQSFRDEFKPLHIPAHYQDCRTDEDKVVYALAQRGEGTADDIAKALVKIDGTLDIDRYQIIVTSVLENLYEKGLIKGTDRAGYIHYDLSKITVANDGGVNPNLLAPGLD